MTISLYLKRPEATEPTTIFAIIFWHGYKLKYYTPEKILSKYWSKETQQAKQTNKFTEYPEFNQRLKAWKTDLANIYRKWINDNNGTIPNPETLKAALDKDLKKIQPEKQLPRTFLGFYEQLIQQTEKGIRLQPKTGKPYSKATIQVYRNTLNRLGEFAAQYRRKIDFDTIDVDFYTDFTGHLSKRLKLASNTIGKDVKTIKTILNEATERGINQNLQYKSRKFSVTREDTNAIYLNEKELNELERLDLSGNKRLEAVRDLFLIGCYTGLRFSDFVALTPEKIKNGFIELEQVKTGAAIVIPVHETINKILSKYNGQLPAAISNQKTNEYLKEIGQQLDSLKGTASKTYTKGGVKVTTNNFKWEVLCTHTARRSFATNEYLAGMPAISIMAITGHKTEKAFLRYIKLTSNEHAKLMQIHWNKRSELKNCLGYIVILNFSK